MSIYTAQKNYQTKQYINHWSLKKNPESPTDYQKNFNNTFDSQYWKSRALKAEEKVAKIIDLEDKIELILNHNCHLREENASLKSFIAEQQGQIEHLRIENSNLNNLPREIEYQQMMTNQRIERIQFQHKIQIEKLLDEISKLHQTLYELEQSKQQQIIQLKEDFDKQLYQQIQNLKKSQNGNIQLYELQVKKLNETIQLKDQQFQDDMRKNTREKQGLQQEIHNLKGDLKYLQIKKEQQLSEIKMRHQYQINRISKQRKIIQQDLNQSHQLEIKKLKKDIGDKMLEIQRLSNKIEHSSEQNQSLHYQLRQQRQKLNKEVASLVLQNSDKIAEVRQRVQKLAQSQIQNILKAAENRTNLLESQIQKLHDLLDMKKKNSQEQINAAHLRRLATNQQFERLEKQNKQLREALLKIQKQSSQELELLKIKMAQLHESDINSVISVYVPKIQSLSNEISLKTTLIQQLRNKLHQQLQAKLHIRKQCQLQVAKLRSSIMELKVKLGAVQIEMQENITSLKSNMDSVSKTFLLDQQLKQKGLKFNEQETRKLRQVIEAKDNQINLTEDNSRKKQEYFLAESARLSQKINILKKQLDDKQEKRIRDLKIRDEQLQSVLSNLEQVKQDRSQIQIRFKNKIAEIKSEGQLLHDKIYKVENQKLILQDKIKKMQHEIALAYGNLENFRMDSEINIQGEKDRMKTVAANSQSSLREFFQRKIKELEDDKSQLTRINTIQSQQIGELVLKYNSLQKNLKDLLQSQRKLTQFQNKVVNLGLDQNLIKNMSQLFKR